MDRSLVLIAAGVVLVAGGGAGAHRLVTDDVPRAPIPRVEPQLAATASSPASTRSVGRPVAVSGTRVSGQPLGADAGQVIAAVTTRLGEPDLTVGPERYFRIPGSTGWHQVADDPLSPTWRYRVTSVTCWGTLCVLLGGATADGLQLRGWELSQHRRWSGSEETARVRRVDVHLARTGITLGDSWRELHAAYPGTVVGGAEGASLTVRHTPWRAASDGAGGWRLSGTWDYTHPDRAPAGAVVTRLAGGEGPQPGCC